MLMGKKCKCKEDEPERRVGSTAPCTPPGHSTRMEGTGPHAPFSLDIAPDQELTSQKKAGQENVEPYHAREGDRVRQGLWCLRRAQKLLCPFPLTLPQGWGGWF